MFSKLIAAMAAIIAWNGAAQAAVITYRFTASLNLVQIVSTNLPSSSYAVRGSSLPTISGIISYESSVDPACCSSPDNAFYLTPVTISLDQFSTTNPSSPTNRLIVLNDPAVYSAYSFLARDSNFDPNPEPYLDAVWFRFNAENGKFPTLAIPTSLSLDELIFGSVTLVTRDNLIGATNVANFLMDSLTPVNEIPLPAAPVMLVTGLAAIGFVSRKARRNAAPS